MNERIRKLAKQATLPGYMLGESYVQSRLDEQKFAELISQECVNVLHDNELWSRDVSHVLKEHFGVE